MTVFQVSKAPQPVIPVGFGRQAILWNLHLTDPVYVSGSPGISALDDSIPPLGSMVVDGQTAMWASSTDPTITVPLQVTAGGLSVAPSPAQAADQLAALGLAKDATVQDTNSQLGMGVAPFVDNLQSFSQVQAGPSGSPYTVHTFGAVGRIWTAHLSFAISSNASHSGNDQAYATLRLNSKPLLVIEVAVGDAASADSGDGDLAIGGIPVAIGDELILDVNNATSIANAIFRASCVCLASFP